MRKIIHIDADSFYASVELRERPDLAGQPIAVGGRPNSRGVIATCNYLARQYGVHSAMPSSQAQRLCPDLVFLPPNFELYREVSRQIQAIMQRYTEIIEPLSLDEAYLDVTESRHFDGSATRIAEAIRAAVRSEVNLTVSAGVAPNKFLAKVASDWNKPDGLFVIPPEQVDAFVRKLPVKKINGVGKVTAQKLADLNVHTCGDLQQLSLELLGKRFGKYGQRLFNMARGKDDRPVQTSRLRKSLSVEHTYDTNLASDSDILLRGDELFRKLVERVDKRCADLRVNKRFVKLKFADFTQTTLEQTINGHERWQDPEAFRLMLSEARQRSNREVRLVGLGVRFLQSSTMQGALQLDLFA
ncbi:MAG: DNA polymerase IV [Oleiphilaceae bacterium]|nr:DNA polymerase IV [Oleiphilaceae bacterium]